MITSRPKIIFKVELIKDTDVQFTLIQMSETYSKLKGNSKFFFTNNNWTVYQGSNFLITKKNIICLPITASRQTTKLIFSTDQERYNFMKQMIKALDSWSKSHFFKEEHKYHKPKINFHKLIWLIF